MKTHSIVILAAAAGVGFVSMLPDEQAPAQERSAAVVEVRSSRPNPWMKDEIQAEVVATGPVYLPRQPDGHFYASVSVDGVESRMLIDTGASIIALTRRDAEAMGVHWDESEVQPIGEGASGTVRGVPVVLERVELGSVEARNVQAVVIPEGLSISLLGQSFLSRIRRVEIDGDNMVLGG